MQGKMSN